MRKEIIDLYENEFMLYQALNLTKDMEKAQDLVQDTLVRIMERQDKYNQNKGTAEGFVTVVMKRIHLNNIRHLKITTRIMDVYAQKYKPSESDMTDYVFCRQLINKTRDKDILKHIALGYTTKDIGEILDININTAFSRARYMRLDLAQFKD